ncbi:hypothetical protein Lpp120_0377 [Lacticaseibacillus paracasei subsp. paracasei Lpp120]|nr:hypothetical protein Lpp120_0377 [Lacticaseibacillus paracasei subsp. paracasei Lpp120]
MLLAIKSSQAGARHQSKLEHFKNQLFQWAINLRERANNS